MNAEQWCRASGYSCRALAMTSRASSSVSARAIQVMKRERLISISLTVGSPETGSEYVVSIAGPFYLGWNT